VSIHIAVNHVTQYRYSRRVSLGPQVVRLRPAPHCRTRILSYSLKVEPGGYFINWQQDAQANHLARLVFAEQTETLRVEVDLIAEMAVLNPFDFFLEPHAQVHPFAYSAAERRALAPYLRKTRPGPRLQQYLAQVPRGRCATVDRLVGLNRQLARDVRYAIRLQPGVQTPEQTLARASGSCRDSGWLLVHLLRHLGLAARFVSGYLIQLKADAPALEGPSGPAEDFTDLHAWCEVYLPGAGWVGLDPTSGLLAGEGHVPLACTAEPLAAAPISGVVSRCKVELQHAMRVQRIFEAPRVTKPYSEQQWAAIRDVALSVDADLAAMDVRLTMGGEPTFVSAEHPDAIEWNGAALGAEKRRLAGALFQRLKERYAPLGLAHFGQGKWYPGEPLPRWSLNCFWRRDGVPLWRERALLVEDTETAGAAQEEAPRRLLEAVAQQLGVPADHAFAAYEDAYYYLWRERRLPANVDPFDSRLTDAQERARLAELFSRGLAQPAGWVLPLAREDASGAWRSSGWFLRGGRCWLLPGDSPLGYRLPLDSLPWLRPQDHPQLYPPDPTAPRDALPAQLLPMAATAQPPSAALHPPSPGSHPPSIVAPTGWIARTALCAQVRAGILYVFMPPVGCLEDYLQLVAAVEAAAMSLSQPIALEGYEPPRDPRLECFRVTPDPGVIEVNIHPAASWSELEERTVYLYEQAQACRLAAEKFMLDGRHTGTGGGNHFVMGAAGSADSPFLRRPDLLASLLAYWHNHPSMSYLFAGLFIGPTSQAPRIDEARNDSLYELELAFAQLPAPGSPCPPWLTDRLFRNLLIDVTGNTHRAEFCIDKLYAPEGPAGRLGLLELRAFEMPPHPRMSLAQQLLLRSLVARFWQASYAPERLARWGTQLHDRFMLPYFVEQDFNDVIAEQNAAGYALRGEWFAPQLEFRFPRYGDFAVQGMQVELRGALEPWPVLGEEAGGAGASRYVDSSLERLQVRVSGLAPDRFCLACNGQRVPLRPTGIAGEFVAGVRYRAWRPASSLHPSIGVHSPLVFDLLDTWTQRSLGGCQYHVTHPGGRHYDTLPVNAHESEARRRSRFFRMGHSPGVVAAPLDCVNPDFPFTLDLRRTRAS
jgi:uncharacterized protein (DUF2126 family)/transglutaminase-like putative cysteine protease